jgi:transposase
LYRIWEGKLSVTMRQTHVGGDKLFVDYAGDTVPVIVDRLTGETRPAQIFVAVMGASNFTYVEATWTQTLGLRNKSRVYNHSIVYSSVSNLGDHLLIGFPDAEPIANPVQRWE